MMKKQKFLVIFLSREFSENRTGGILMAVTQRTMTEEQRKSVELEYLKRLDQGKDFFDLFSDDAQVYFPKWGIANGLEEVQHMFSYLASIVKSIRHDYAYFNYISHGDHLAVERTSHGVTAGCTE